MWQLSKITGAFHTLGSTSSSHPAHLSHSNTLCQNTLPYMFMRRLQMKASANYVFNSRFSSISRGMLRAGAKGLTQRLWTSDLKEFCPHVVQNSFCMWCETSEKFEEQCRNLIYFYKVLITAQVDNQQISQRHAVCTRCPGFIVWCFLVLPQVIIY